MNLKILLEYTLFVCAALCLAGIALFIVHHALRQKRMQMTFEYIDKLVPRIKNIVIDATSDCMDILPEKILKAKKAIDEDTNVGHFQC